MYTKNLVRLRLEDDTGEQLILMTLRRNPPPYYAVTVKTLYLPFTRSFASQSTVILKFLDKKERNEESRSAMLEDDSAQGINF